MRKATVVWNTVTILGLSAFALGCATPPHTSVDAALTAHQAAEQAGAEEWANESFRAAVDAQAALDAELRLQADRFAMLRSYDRVASLATAARDASVRAEREAAIGLEQTRADASQMIGEAREMAMTTQTALATAPGGKGTAQDLAAFRADLQAATTLIAEADEAFVAGRYRDALTKAGASKTASGNVTLAIEQARAARLR